MGRFTTPSENSIVYALVCGWKAKALYLRYRKHTAAEAELLTKLLELSVLKIVFFIVNSPFLMLSYSFC